MIPQDLGPTSPRSSFSNNHHSFALPSLKNPSSMIHFSLDSPTDSGEDPNFVCFTLVSKAHPAGLEPATFGSVDLTCFPNAFLMLEKAPGFQGLLLLPRCDNASTKRRFRA